LLSVVIVKTYLLPARASNIHIAAANANVGTSLKGRLPGVDWSKNGRTLVLAISTQCHFCTESAPFFRRVKEEAGKNPKMVALLPQSVTEAERYLSGQGVKVDQIVQVQPGTLGIRGTPTLMLVNHKGVITKLWTGKIPDSEQDAVLSILKKG